jgi:hypothetical protein
MANQLNSGAIVADAKIASEEISRREAAEVPASQDERVLLP